MVLQTEIPKNQYMEFSNFTPKEDQKGDFQALLRISKKK